MKCHKCGKDKPLINFYQNYRIKNGYNPICKACLKIQREEYYKQKEKPKEIIKNPDWSNTAIMCYERNCICSDCFFDKFFSDKEQKCQMKFAVIELVKKFGIPKEVEEDG